MSRKFQAKTPSGENLSLKSSLLRLMGFVYFLPHVVWWSDFVGLRPGRGLIFFFKKLQFGDF